MIFRNLDHYSIDISGSLEYRYIYQEQFWIYKCTSISHWCGGRK